MRKTKKKEKEGKLKIKANLDRIMINEKLITTEPSKTQT